MDQLTPDEADLDEAWTVLHQHARVSVSNHAAAGTDLMDIASSDGKMVAALNYPQACKAAAACPANIGPHLTASAFLRMRRDVSGSVPVSRVYDYLARRSAMLQLRQQLQKFTDDGRGSVLSVAQLQQFVTMVLEPLLAAETSVAETTLTIEQYVDVATHKLMFFHGRGTRVFIKDLMASPVLAEMLSQQPRSVPPEQDPVSLQLVPSPTPPPLGETETNPDAVIPPGAESDSWFAPQTAARIITQFRSLDSQGQGALTEEDLNMFGSGRLTRLFISRVLEEHGSNHHDTERLSEGGLSTRKGASSSSNALDFQGFVRLLLAWEHRDSVQGFRYLWPIMDLRHCGHLSRGDVAVWFRGVEMLWHEQGLSDTLRVEDVVNEVFDMAAPANTQLITREDLAQCGAASTIIGMLCDLTAFWEHDNREAMLAEESQNELEAEHAALALGTVLPPATEPDNASTVVA